MPLTLVAKKDARSLPVYPVKADGLDAVAAPPEALAWARAHGFSGAAGKVLTVPDENAVLAGAFFGMGEAGEALATGGLARHLPEGSWHFATLPTEGELAALGLMLGSYAFTRYGKKPSRNIRFAVPDGVDAARVGRLAEGSFLARDLINTPAGDMGPDKLEEAARALAKEHGAEISVIEGDALLDRNLPMIHAVGRAAAQPPRRRAGGS